eukprot:18341-Rhodomonas_salina.1
MGRRPQHTLAPKPRLDQCREAKEVIHPTGKSIVEDHIRECNCAQLTRCRCCCHVSKLSRRGITLCVHFPRLQTQVSPEAWKYFLLPMNYDYSK